MLDDWVSVIPRPGSGKREGSTLITSAPQWARTPPQPGTNIQAVTSTTRTPCRIFIVLSLPCHVELQYLALGWGGGHVAPCGKPRATDVGTSGRWASRILILRTTFVK